MKRLVPLLLTGLSLALLFLVGCDWLLRTSEFASLLLGRGAEWPDWHSQLGVVQQWLVTIAMMLLPILTAASWLLANRDNSIRTLTASGDVIRLAPSAIERVVCREVRANVAEVIRVGAEARQGKKGPAVVVNVATSDKVPVPQVDADVRRETVAVLRQLLGVGDPSEVKIVVYDVQSASPRTVEKRRRDVEKSKGESLPIEKKPLEQEKPKAPPPPPPVAKQPAKQPDPPKPPPPFPPKAFEAEAAAKPGFPSKPLSVEAPKESAPKAFGAEPSKDDPLKPKP